MRWGSTGNGSFGVGATAYTLASRDENACYYYYQEPAVPSTASSGVFEAPQSHGQVRGAVYAKKPPDKRQGKRISGSNARFSRPNREVKIPSLANGEGVSCPEVASGEPESTGRQPLIVCAGKSVYGATCEDRDNNGNNQRSGECVGQQRLNNNDSDAQHNNLSAPFRTIAAAKTNCTSGLDSPPQHRTDEELEQIIRELRDQVFQNQQKLDVSQRGKPPSITSSVGGDSPTRRHHRKHLKNPIEKMESSVPVTASAESLILQRPLSSSQLNRLVSENTIQMVVPAVIYEGPGATSRAGAKPTNSVISLDFSSLRSVAPRSRPSSSSSSQPGRKTIAPRLPASTRRRREKRSNKLRENDGYENSSDASESFLYLVDGADSEDGPESLSPVGPWVVDQFPAATTGTDTPRSVSTCYSVSSLGSEDLDNNGDGEWGANELAAMSPRSRLLYFSACADDSDTSRSMQQHYLQRSATCSSDLLASMKLAGLESRATSAKRTSSANASSARRKPRATSASGVSKQKARSNQARKHPQSEGATSSRST